MRMRLMVLGVTVVMALGGCATATKTYTADGREGYNIDCSGDVANWGTCYEKAGEVCGARGYNILERAGDQTGAVVGNEFGLYGGTVASRNLIIACK